MEDKINEFIKRRFALNCQWNGRNAFFFCKILQTAFGGEIYYDVENNRFILQCENNFYDWNGKVEDCGITVKWSDFERYDKMQKERITVEQIM